MTLRSAFCSAWAAVLLAGCAVKPPADTARETPRTDPRLQMRDQAVERLRELGRAYAAALKTAPPQGPDDLRVHLKSPEETLFSPRDREPFEVLWGVDPRQFPQDGLQRMIAWEKTSDDDGYRVALLADCEMVIHMNEELFKRLLRRVKR
jgi:hypothetical protein